MNATIATALRYFDAEAAVEAGSEHYGQSHYSVRVTIGSKSDLRRNLTASEAAAVIRTGVNLAEMFEQELTVEFGQERG